MASRFFVAQKLFCYGCVKNQITDGGSENATTKDKGKESRGRKLEAPVGIELEALAGVKRQRRPGACGRNHECREAQRDLYLRKNLEARVEARVGIEPTHKGFADLSLTTWVPRLTIEK